MTNLYKIPEIQWLEETTSDTHKSVNTIREYVIRPNSPTNPESKLPYVVCYNGKPQTYWNTVAEAREWVATVNYPSVVAEYLEPVSEPVSDILDWFKLAKPEPDYNNFLTQYACHIEEFLEMLIATGANEHEQYRFYEQLGDYCNDLKTLKVPEEYHELQASFIDKTELLDSLCDQIVTALGVGYMFGFDMQSALKEVIRSNWSKFENGKPIFDENGKIAKPASYSKPNLEPFLGVSHDAD